MDVFQKRLTRRGLLQTMAATASVAALAGCSGKDGDSYYIPNGENDSWIPVIPSEEYTVAGAFGHNCGGRCLTVAHIRNGVIKRFTSDERPDRNLVDNTGDDPQRRACLRCRGKQTWLYRPDRLLYPLKQTGVRGDVTTFQRISWEDAATEIDAKMKAIAAYSSTDAVKNPNNRDVIFDGNYGLGAFIDMHSTGDTSTIVSAVPCVTNFMNAYAACPEYINGMFSYPQVSTVAAAIMGGEGGVSGNSRQDMLNSELIINWACSIADAVIETNSLWYMLQAREKGVKFITVDTYVTRTATTLGGRCLCPVPGTDSAMIAGMVYYIIEEHIKACGTADPLNTDTRYINMTKLKKYTFGFFENDNPKYYRNADGTPVGVGGTSDIQSDPNVAVPPGASYSAYIFGSDPLLVEKGMNRATSVYPDTIGYNVRPPGHLNAGDPGDPLYGKKMPVYGQVKKTPAWASKICGVPEDDIKWLAEQIISHKTSFYSGGGGGGGGQRTCEGEQFVFSYNALALLTGCYGENGRTFGMSAGGRKGTLMYPYYAPTQNYNYLYHNYMKRPVIHNDVINKNRANYDKLSYPALTKTQSLTKIQLYGWLDQAEWGGKGKSKWYDPNVMYGPPLRAMINCAGNTVNQSGDCTENIRVVRDTNSLDLVLTVDAFMTPTAQYADYVLPASVHFEKDGALGGFSYTETLLNIPRAIQAPGEAKSELEIFEMITDKSGLKEVINANISARDAIRDYYENTATLGEANPPSFEEFEKEGIYTKSGTHRPLEIAWADFIADPEANPLPSMTGRFHVYAQLLMEVYEARRYNNFDNISGSGVDNRLIVGRDANGDEVVASGRIYTKACTFTGHLQNAADKPAEYLTGSDTVYGPADAAQQEANERSARFVYPIPMYIPQAEGKHACDNDSSMGDYPAADANGATKHPDPLGLRTGYPFIITTYHALFRSHSTNNNSSYVNETYKIGDNGKPAFLPYERELFNTVPHSGSGEPMADRLPEAWETGVYEPVSMHPSDAGDLKDGDRVIIESPRAKIYAAVRLSKINRPGTLRMAEGAWVSFKEIGGETIDVGGSASSLMEKRPSRIGQGATMAGGCRVKVRKALY